MARPKLTALYEAIRQETVPRFQTRLTDIIAKITNARPRKVERLPRHALYQFGLAVVMVALVTIIKLLMLRYLGVSLPFLIYFSSIILVTAYGGMGPGILTTIFSATTAGYFFLGVSDNGWGGMSAAEFTALGVFLFEGILITVVTSALRLARIETKTKTQTIETQEQALVLAGERTSAILESLEDGFYTVNKDWIYTDLNSRGAEILGFSKEELIGKSMKDLFPSTTNFFKVAQEAMDTGQNQWVESHYKTNNRWYESSIYPQPDGLIIFSKDISDQVLAREQLEKSEQHFRTLVEAVEDYAIFALDLDGRIISWNEGVGQILGYGQDEVIGKHLRDLFTAEDQILGIPEQELERVRKEGDVVQEGLRVRKDGSTFHAISTITPMRDEAGNLTGYSKIMRDVTEKKEAEETIRYQAYHDTLTGLANRESLYERFVLAQAAAQRHSQKLAILFLDLDRFKVINDTLGHSLGDLILREVADRLTQSVRKNDLVVRLGGDEFILMLTEINQIQDVMKIAEKILQAFEPVMRVQNHSLHVSTSFGIAVFPEDGQDIHALMKNADIALYRAKEEGRSRYQFYNYRMNLQSVERLSLEQDLRRAVADNQLQMAYQPFVEVSSGKVLGVEALVRWNHPRLGTLYPSEFIPISEETGMIDQIGEWILRTVCQQGKELHDAGFPLSMSVNLSARQFAQERIVDTITEALRTTQFRAQSLELEITESIAMENISRTSSKLNELKRLGIAIAIDDFGTGYSSLSYLKRFPVHKLKIDKSFIKHSLVDSQDFAIVRAIISMGNSLGLQVCAEGIEEQAQLDLLSAMDCQIAQGFFISKPLFADSLIDWLKKHQ